MMISKDDYMALVQRVSDLTDLASQKRVLQTHDGAYCPNCHYQFFAATRRNNSLRFREYSKENKHCRMCGQALEWIM